jgi:hypothetical protein
MRTVGTKLQYRVTDQPDGRALQAAAALQEVALALAAVPSTGIAIGVYRFQSHAAADAHAQAGLARAMAANARLRTAST